MKLQFYASIFTETYEDDRSHQPVNLNQNTDQYIDPQQQDIYAVSDNAKISSQYLTQQNINVESQSYEPQSPSYSYPEHSESSNNFYGPEYSINDETNSYAQDNYAQNQQYYQESYNALDEEQESLQQEESVVENEQEVLENIKDENSEEGGGDEGSESYDGGSETKGKDDNLPKQDVKTEEEIEGDKVSEEEEDSGEETEEEEEIEIIEEEKADNLEQIDDDLILKEELLMSAEVEKEAKKADKKTKEGILSEPDQHLESKEGTEVSVAEDIAKEPLLEQTKETEVAKENTENITENLEEVSKDEQNQSELDAQHQKQREAANLVGTHEMLDDSNRVSFIPNLQTIEEILEATNPGFPETIVQESSQITHEITEEIAKARNIPDIESQHHSVSETQQHEAPTAAPSPPPMSMSM